jgi:uncharacterized membrane protein YuzA (DUF378 family)
MTSYTNIVEFVYHLYILLVLIGALNWGLVAIDPKYNLVERIPNEIVKRVIYTVIGLSAVILMATKIYHGTLYPKDVHNQQCNDDRYSTYSP